MSKGRLIATITVVVVAFTGLVIFSQTNKAPVDYGQYRISNIKTLADRQFDYELNPDKIYEASEDTGGLPEKVIGDPSKAKVVLYEYADYACAHCAEWSRSLDLMVEKSNGDLAVVYRGYLLPGFKNNLVAASAATAAQIQGCWKEYKDLLYADQSEWTSLSGSALEDKLITCFQEASGGKGDIEQFKSDMKSEAVAKKIAFEYRLGKETDLKGTPSFRIDGQNIEIKDLRETVDKKLTSAA